VTGSPDRPTLSVPGVRWPVAPPRPRHRATRPGSPVSQSWCRPVRHLRAPAARPRVEFRGCLDDLEQENERLRDREGETFAPLEDYDEFLSLDSVRAEIEAAKEACTASPRYVRGVIASIIAEGGAVSYEAIAERLGVSTTSDVSKAASELERRKIITKDRHDDGMYVDLNVDGVQEVRRAAAEREKTEELMESL
jgi:DNA-binding MarR family transcriptional regulator